MSNTLRKYEPPKEVWVADIPVLEQWLNDSPAETFVDVFHEEVYIATYKLRVAERYLGTYGKTLFLDTLEYEAYWRHYIDLALPARTVALLAKWTSGSKERKGIIMRIDLSERSKSLRPNLDTLTLTLNPYDPLITIPASLC